MHLFFSLLYLHLFHLSFELIQLGTGWGVFDIDDIFLNTLGCLIGIIIYHFINQHRQNNVSTSLFLLSFGSIGLRSPSSHYIHHLRSNIMEKKLNKKEKFFIVLVLGVITIFSIVIKYYSMHL